MHIQTPLEMLGLSLAIPSRLDCPSGPSPLERNAEALVLRRGRKPSGDSNKGSYAPPPQKMHTKACPQFQGFPVSLEARMSPSLGFPFESNLHRRRVRLRTQPRLWGHRLAQTFSAALSMETDCGQSVRARS